MKKIIINGRFLVHKVTGVERYAREILAELDKIVDFGEIEMAVPSEIIEFPKYKNIKIVKVGKFNNRMWEHISFPAYVMKQKGISLNLCNTAPLLNPGIVCIHDVKIKAVPQYFNRKFLFWYNLLFNNEIKRGKAIITVSEFSKKEIVKYYRINSNKIFVIPNAWQHYKRIGYDDYAMKKYGVESDKYFFSMCSLEPNKNFRWIAEAAKRNPNQIFAVAGAINKKVFADGLGFKCPKNMKLLGYISDEEAKTLMKNCKAFLFPTFYEGFGIPPLEAVSAGAKQIVVSDTEVMHEIFGESVIYVNPNDYEFHYKELNNNYDKSEILNKFSWKKSALKLNYLLTKCVGEL